MKTYKTYGACERHQNAQPFPVHTEGATVWATRSALRAMEQVTNGLVFSPGLAHKMAPDKFDRVFAVVSDGKSWGILTVLSRGFPAEWPHSVISKTIGHPLQSKYHLFVASAVGVGQHGWAVADHFDGRVAVRLALGHRVPDLLDEDVEGVLDPADNFFIVGQLPRAHAAG